MKTIIQPTFFLSHGGGPWPWLRNEMSFMDGLHQSLLKVVKSLPEKPKAILIISGHWEEENFKIMSSAKPSMIYDYFGFPDFTYKISYPAPGHPHMAEKIQGLLKENNIASELDPNRGFDHGVYSLLYPMFPEADIPIVQVSMKKTFDSLEHFNLGKALKSLRSEGVLIIGSGNIFHNLRAMRNSKKESAEFDTWIRNVVTDSDLEKRNKNILNWESAPFARFCQPVEDHLVPLFFAMGAASEDKGQLIYGEPLMNIVSVSSYRFG